VGAEEISHQLLTGPGGGEAGPSHDVRRHANPPPMFLRDRARPGLCSRTASPLRFGLVPALAPHHISVRDRVVEQRWILHLRCARTALGRCPFFPPPPRNSVVPLFTKRWWDRYLSGCLPGVGVMNAGGTMVLMRAALPPDLHSEIEIPQFHPPSSARCMLSRGGSTSGCGQIRPLKTSYSSPSGR